MKTLLLISCCMLTLQVYCQVEIKNTYSVWHEVYGGMSDGGINRTESYLFVAKKKVTLKGVYYEHKEVTLNAGDSIQISKYSYKSYSEANNNAPKEAEPEELPVEKRFSVFKKNNCYYASVQYPYVWDGVLHYIYKKKKLKTKIKTEFDAGKTDYAP